ncbi:MAG TPA: pseudaminic acid cytidylyltransferase [Chitinophagaceae bacterium]|nr:pseudaminic acid cytidylyltransferase [Chitinophagaceae bacterium]
MKNVAIITARGGSKRIPGKNIKDFLGKPIIAYSIETALTSGLFEDVIVSTDDNEIAAIAKQYGASVPFMRSIKNADDYATTADVIIEVLEQLSLNGKKYSSACCIYPTAPLLNTASLLKGYSLLMTRNYDSVFPVCAFSYPILRSLIFDEAGKVSMKWPENLNKRSQDMPKFFHDAGQFYWFNTSGFSNKKKLYTDNSGSIILNELQVQDIDNEMDWKLAEAKYKLLLES